MAGSIGWPLVVAAEALMGQAHVADDQKGVALMAHLPRAGQASGAPRLPGSTWPSLTQAGATRPGPDLYAVPILDRFLLYAPLHNLAALIDRRAALYLHESLANNRSLDASTGGVGASSPGYRIGARREPDEPDLAEIARVLGSPGDPAPEARRGDFAPLFLGLLPTRACTMACRYCGFHACAEPEAAMGLQLARAAVDWYMDLLAANGEEHAEVHFFGGEPFCAPEVLDLAVPYARARARALGCTIRFEVATNGLFDERRCHWVADNLDTVVLSLDGPAEIQDRQRPRRDGQGSLAAVVRSARILSEGAAELNLRACVPSETVEQLPEIASWFCRDLRPAAVSLEPVQPSSASRSAHLEPPDPWSFGRKFVAAARILEAQGVEAVYATADIGARRVSFCPVARDAAIVSPDGTISACYLPSREWEAKGFDLHLGRMVAGRADLDPQAVALARGLNVWNKPHCRHCFCRWHCAGGCHVNHRPPEGPGTYDRLCIQTRIIALRNILKAMGQDGLAGAWLEDRRAMERTVRQSTDLLLEGAVEP